MNVGVLNRIQEAIAAHAVENAHGEQDKFSVADHDYEHEELVNYKQEFNSLSAELKSLGNPNTEPTPPSIYYADQQWSRHYGAAGGPGSPNPLHDVHQNYATESWLRQTLSAHVYLSYDEGPDNTAGKDLVDKLDGEGTRLADALDELTSDFTNMSQELARLQGLLNDADGFISEAREKANEIRSIKDAVISKRLSVYDSYMACDSRITDLENRIYS